MESTTTFIIENTKKFLLIINYMIWLVLDPSKFKRVKKEKIKKVLIVHLGSLGELLITTSPLFPALKKELKCDLSFMVSKGKENAFKNNPYISKVLVYKNNFKEDIKQVKKENFDLAVILYPGSTKVSLMCLFGKIKYRIGCFSGIKGGPSLFFTKRVFPISKKHAIKKTLGMIEQIGVYNKNPKLNFYVSNKEKKDLKKILNKLKVKDYMIVHPSFSSIMKYKYPSRLWPLERYSKVIDYLIEEYNLPVFITGGRDEKEISKKIKEKAKNKNKIIIANDLFELRGLISLISQAKLLISCGAIAPHIAAAFNTPTVIFEGKGNPLEWHPWCSKKNYRLLFHPEVCTCCHQESCRKKTIECMKAITLDEVINAADELLEPNKK